MMGNERSQLSGLEVDDQAIETTDFWAHYQATIKDSCRYFSIKSDGSVSVFKGESVLGPLWTLSTPLEKFANNLLKYRHPCIVRYLSAWKQRTTNYLATEYVLPLSHILNSLTPLQKCIGLNNILRALVFLHDQAEMSHNNVCISSIYVTGDGQWKLGALQYLCPFSQLTPAYLKQARIHRYDKGVDPNEGTYETTTKVDQYAFAVLVQDLFADCKDDEVPHLLEFRKYCQEHLQHKDVSKRIRLSEILQHNFFNHDFISIYKFLSFLPLKSEEEKSNFFSTILDSLKCYDEETVAKQFGGLLLSRLTLLDSTARRAVIPFIFRPRDERVQEGINGFFTLVIFKEHVIPRLLQLFGVRDTQIRMLLLTHFTKYVQMFSHEELSQHILPELLLGIKDTDDSLVAATLVCLSELVPILGADTVVGGKRSKLFSDGRPKSTLNADTPSRSFVNSIPSKSLKDFSCSEQVLQTGNSFDKIFQLDERPSPVGGEADEVTAMDSRAQLAQSEDEWSDWDSKNHQLVLNESDMFIEPQPDERRKSLPQAPEGIFNNSSHESQQGKTKASVLQKAALEAKMKMIDISDLDIKNQRYESAKGDEFDFFADMKPVIEKPQVVNIPVSDTTVSKLNFVPEDGGEEEIGAWGDSWN